MLLNCPDGCSYKSTDSGLRNVQNLQSLRELIMDNVLCNWDRQEAFHAADQARDIRVPLLKHAVP